MTSPARRLLLLLLSTAVFFVLLHLAAKTAFRLGFVAREFADFFSVSQEGNLPTWFSATQLAAVGILCLLVSGFSRFDISPGASRRFWAILGIVFLVLSIDEACSLHEHFDRAHFSPSLASHWVYNLAPAVLLAGAACYFVGKRLLRGHPPVFRLMALGGAILFLSSMVMDLLFYRILYDRVVKWEKWGSHSLVNVPEEFLEMAGVSLILCAVLDYFLKTTDLSGLTGPYKAEA